jgi:hypothetical protein
MDVIGGGEEGVAGGLKFSLERGFEFGLQFCGARGVDEVLELIGIGFVVEEEPRAVEVADVGVACGANSAILVAAALASPFSERGDAGNKGCAV